jgi:hypothetical protein
VSASGSGHGEEEKGGDHAGSCRNHPHHNAQEAEEAKRHELDG